MARLLILTALALIAALPASATAAVPADATWEQHYIDTPDGEQLHVDLLKPKGLAAGQKTPVIAVISPYLGHAADGIPSDRFKDFFDGAKPFQKGYSVALIDLRGSGGSSGCLDILGPGEQMDIKTGVEWAASQPWSNGRVGMYGKSYDGNTGVAGAAIRPTGLHAVVAQQVVGDRYSGSYSGGVRYLQSVAYPFVSYGTQAEGGWTEQDDEQYAINSFSHSVDCQAGLAGHYDNNPNTEFWKARDFVAKGKGSSVPFFMTHGFLDVNTNIGAKAIDFYNGLTGPKRLWLGWWAHDRGNDMVGKKLAMGRAGWFDEVMRFYDEHLKGIRPARRDPDALIQDSNGKWRSEQNWPPADAQAFTAPLKAGSYDDDANNMGSNDPSAGAGGSGATPGEPTYGAGAWTVSPPLPHTAHLAGIPTAKVDVAPVAPNTNLVVNLYDIAPNNKATMISRGARLVSGAGVAELPLYPVEWTLAPGHRLGVLVNGANAEAWIHAPTNTTVPVRGGSVTLPFLRTKRTSDQPGEPTPRLGAYKTNAPFDVAAGVMQAATQAALVPPAQVDPPTPTATATQPSRDPFAEALQNAQRSSVAVVTGKRPGLRYSVRISRRSLKSALRRGLAARATCSAPCTMTIAVKRGRRTVATARITKAFRGTRSVRLRFTKSARRSLRRARTAKLSVHVTASDALERRATSRGTLRLGRR